MQDTLYNLYCDESRHLENDHFPVMAIGYVKVEAAEAARVQAELTDLKRLHHTPVEIKWSKVSTSRLPLYKALIDYFFAQPLRFRCILVKYKQELDHDQFNNGSHDNFYYKLVFHLLRPNQEANCNYRAFLDIKDTRGREKLQKIREVFQNYHHGSSPFTKFQHIHSHDSVLMELADLFIGAITYKATKDDQKPDANPAKKALITYLEEKSGYFLDEGTEPWEQKFNLFDHQPKRHLHG